MTVIPATWTWPAALAAAVLAGASAPVAAKEPIEIGMAVAMTGYLANYDGQFVEGAKLAAKRANDHGGIDGHPVELHALDDASNATTGVTITNQLLNQYNVSVMLNGLSSAQNGAIEPILARAKVPQIHISELPPDPVWAFQANIPHDKVSDLELDYAAQGLHAKKVAILYSHTPYGQVGAKVLHDGAVKRGLKVVYSDGVEPSATDMTPQLAKLKDAAPDVVIDVLTGSTHIVEAKAAATVGLAVPILMAGDDMPTYRKVVAEYPAMAFAAEPCQAYPFIPDPKLKAAYEVFYADFHQAGLKDAELSGVTLGWDAMTILAKAVETSGVTGGDKLRAALETLSVQGANTRYAFSAADHSGQEAVPNVLQMAKVKGDSVEIVFPK